MPIDLTEFERGAPFTGDSAEALATLQDQLARLQVAQIVHRKRAIILFEGWIGSGKKAALRRLVGAWDPSHVRVRSVGGADKADDDRHWLAPFWSRLPAAGDTTIFYRSWYRRIVEERVGGTSRRQALGPRLRRDQRVRSPAARPWDAGREAVLPCLGGEPDGNAPRAPGTIRGGGTSCPKKMWRASASASEPSKCSTTCSSRPTRAGHRGR